MHLLAIAVVLAYLMFSSAEPAPAEAGSRHVFCSSCRTNHYPENPCACRRDEEIARAHP